MKLFAKKFKMTYDYKVFYENAMDEYKEGQIVVLKYSVIATDTRYSFLLNGEDVSYNYENGSFVIRFVMPAKDSYLECITVNTMVAPQIQKILSVSIETVATVGGDSYRNISIVKQEGNYLLSNGSKQIVISSEEVDKISKLCDSLEFELWDSLKKYACLEGARYSLSYSFDKEISVSSDKMPSDGSGKIREVYSYCEHLLSSIH